MGVANRSGRNSRFLAEDSCGNWPKITNRISLFADRTQPLLAPSTFFAGVQAQITDDLLAVPEAAHRSHCQIKPMRLAVRHSCLLH